MKAEEKEKEKEKETFTPFSNGTEALVWYSENCESCTKAFFPKDGKEYPSDETMRKYCSTGKECKLKYQIDLAFVTGSIPMDTAKQIGLGLKFGLKETCLMFSDNEDDGYKPPKRPKPDNTPQNQLCMPFELMDILEGHEVKINELISER